MWLDPVAEPLARRAAAAEWTPDGPGDYCDRCGRDIGAFESNEVGCAACAQSRLPWSRFVRLGRYEPPLSDWICEVKFTRWPVLGLELGRLLGRVIRQAGIDPTPGRAVIVPMPTTIRRRLSRGIDHAGIIARGVSEEVGPPIARLLARSHRPSQRAVPFDRRPSNVAGSLRLRRGAAVPAGTILLVDDVMTSGATMRAAARALLAGAARRNGPEVWACALGVTADHAP